MTALSSTPSDHKHGAERTGTAGRRGETVIWAVSLMTCFPLSGIAGGEYILQIVTSGSGVKKSGSATWTRPIRPMDGQVWKDWHKRLKARHWPEWHDYT